MTVRNDTNANPCKPAHIASNEGMDNAKKNDNDDNEDAAPSITMIAKWGKERIELTNLSPSLSIEALKELLAERTGVLPKQQKLMGLVVSSSVSSLSCVSRRKPPLSDDVLLGHLQVKGSRNSNNKNIVHTFLLMGTPEEKIFVDPGKRDDLPDVLDDFDLDFNAGSDEWIQHAANESNLRKFTQSTKIHLMNSPRPSLPLLVLDLDRTLLDFSSKTLINAPPQPSSTSTNNQNSTDPAAQMKRPYMDQFLTSVHRHYDLAVWSQTSWRWLETKLIELGMLTHPGYSFCFVLDKTSMFQITSVRKKDGKKVRHCVKPLRIIWDQFGGRWGEHNTVHLDDLERNFALNVECGLRVSPFRRGRRGRADVELLGLARYFEELARNVEDFREVNFQSWMDVVMGKKGILDDTKKNKNNNNNKDENEGAL